MSKTEDVINKHLDELGDTSEEIANTLFNLGFFGRTMSIEKCPISRYLANQLNTFVFVTPKFVFTEITLKHYPLPESIRQFICDFDNGKYPFLIQGNVYEQIDHMDLYGVWLNNKNTNVSIKWNFK